MDGIEKYRLPHESDEEWNLRRSFLETHQNSFPRNRLLCLASCFVNVKCYGCRYPVAVMKQLEELTDGLESSVKDHSRQRIRMPPVQFVRATPEGTSAEDHDKKHSQDVVVVKQATDSRTKICGDMQSSFKEPAADIPPCTVVHKNEGSFTVPQEQFRVRNTCPPERGSHQEDKFYLFSRTMRDVAEKVKIQNDAELIQISASKCKIPIKAQILDERTELGFTCELFIDEVLVATGSASNKKQAKHVAFANASCILRKPYLHIENASDRNGRPTLAGADKPFSEPVSVKNTRGVPNFDMGVTKLGQSTAANINSLTRRRQGAGPAGAVRPMENAAASNRPAQAQKRTVSQMNGDLNSFVIFKQHKDDTNPINDLRQSADFNKRHLDYICSTEGSDHCRCQVSLGGRIIADIISSNADQKTAKMEAATQAMKYLSRLCCTIIPKQPAEALPEDAMKRQEVLGNQTEITNNTIPDSNVGSKLLKKMGWTGGGVGKEGNRGIEEPISLEAVVNRAGLGSHKDSGFAAAVARVIKDFVLSERHDDLIFSPEFTTEERAVIHTEAHRHHLRTRSYGQGEERYLILSLKRTPIQLAQHIRNNGGETAKYMLFEATS